MEFVFETDSDNNIISVRRGDKVIRVGDVVEFYRKVNSDSPIKSEGVVNIISRRNYNNNIISVSIRYSNERTKFVASRFWEFDECTYKHMLVTVKNGYTVDLL